MQEIVPVVDDVVGGVRDILIDRLFLLFARTQRHKNNTDKSSLARLESIRWLCADEREECEWGPEKKEEGSEV